MSNELSLKELCHGSGRIAFPESPERAIRCGNAVFEAVEYQSKTLQAENAKLKQALEPQKILEVVGSAEIWLADEKGNPPEHVMDMADVINCYEEEILEALEAHKKAALEGATS